MAMTASEYLYAYCQLTLHGYKPDEAKKIIEEMKAKMTNETR
ncbi:hypothetical protein ACUXCC_005578 [Cytobacillus horneckiae]|nr:hypothetical protein [Cytobacillus horneckiae]